MSVKKLGHLGILNLAFRCHITLPNTRAQPHTRKLQYPHARSTYAVPQVPESLLEALRRHSKLHGSSIDFLRVRASAPLQTQIRILDVRQSPRGRTHISYMPKLYTFKLLVASRSPGPRRAPSTLPSRTIPWSVRGAAARAPQSVDVWPIAKYVHKYSHTPRAFDGMPARAPGRLPGLNNIF